MCGIVGIRRFDGVRIDEILLRTMANQVGHRGPDAEGYWYDESVAFGHKRLSIIDPTGSCQPMGAHGVQVCFNGEVFNYRELRKELAKGGYLFSTQGDVEVLLALFLDAGPRGVHRLLGQFAYAIYNEKEKDLWLFRDHLGVQPLYYYWDERVFVFASEIKALLPALPRRPQVDDDSLKEYLAYRSVPFPNTLFKGIRKLPPGHMLCLNSHGNLNIKAFWSLPTGKIAREIDKKEAVELVSRAIEKAVDSRLVSDVPVGAYLSGGVDSSLVVAIMTKLRGGEPVETFSAGFGDPRYDELRFARKVSRMFHTKHHEVIIKPQDFQTLWPKLTWHRDAPLSEPADLAIFKLASLAQQTVKVLLSGEGSDELFAGYPKYRFASWAALADGIPVVFRKHIFRSLERTLPARFAKLRIMLRATSAPSEADRFQTWFAPFTSYERAKLLPGKERNNHWAIWERARGDVVQRMLYVDCHTWLVDNLLERGDRMSMAASVESRPPFLDYHLVELVFGLPSSLKIHKGSTKWILKEVARKSLPTDIVDRKKVGFRVPLDLWFRENLREVAQDLLLSPGSYVASRMDRKFIRSLLENHYKRRQNEEIRIWTLLCLEIWHQIFFKDRAFMAIQPITTTPDSKSF